MTNHVRLIEPSGGVIVSPPYSTLQTLFGTLLLNLYPAPSKVRVWTRHYRRIDLAPQGRFIRAASETREAIRLGTANRGIFLVDNFFLLQVFDLDLQFHSFGYLMVVNQRLVDKLHIILINVLV